MYKTLKHTLILLFAMFELNQSIMISELFCTIPVFPQGKNLCGVLEVFPEIMLSLNVEKKSEYVLVNGLDLFLRQNSAVLPGNDKV